MYFGHVAFGGLVSLSLSPLGCHWLLSGASAGEERKAKIAIDVISLPARSIHTFFAELSICVLALLGWLLLARPQKRRPHSWPANQ